MFDRLPRREREIYETLCGLGEATSEQLRSAIPAPPGNSAMRALLARMERRGAITHRVEGCAYVFRPLDAPQNVASDVLRRVIETHFGGSAASAATHLLGGTQPINEEELDAIEAAIKAARAR